MTIEQFVMYCELLSILGSKINSVEYSCFSKQVSIIFWVSVALAIFNFLLEIFLKVILRKNFL